MNGLAHSPLGEIATLNPTFREKEVSFDELVDFLPMSAVRAELTTVRATEQRTFQAVQKGYTNFADGDVLLAKITPCFENGKIAVAHLNTDYGFGSTEFHVIRADRTRLDGRYLVHFLRRNEIRLDGARNMTGSGGQRRVPRHYLSSLSVPLPPLPEQNRIADILDQVDALRAKRREALVELDNLKQSIFIEMFGDPIANDRGWPWASVSDFVAGFESGKSIVADDEDNTSSLFRVLKISAVTSLEFKPEHSKAMPSDYIPPVSHIVRKGDLLFSRANTAELIGATAFVAETPDNLLLPDKLWRFVWFEKPRAALHYVRHLFQQKKFRFEIALRASGSSGSMKNISQPKILSIQVGHPPLSLQELFSSRIQVIDDLKTSQRASLRALDDLFASLQHRAFRGEL